MLEKRDDRLTTWQLRWNNRENWISDVISCLRGEPHEKAVRRILRLPWYSRENGFQFLSYSRKQDALILDLRGIPLRNVDLSNIIIPFALLEGADLYKSSLEKADLSFVRAINASFHQARLDGATLTAARLDGSDLSLAALNGADLSRAHLEGADLGWSELKGTKLRSAYLDGANLERAKAPMADFSEAQINRANFSVSVCTEASFENAKLCQTKFVAAKLERTNFADTDLNEADLSLAYLQDAYLISAALKKADLTRAHLERADLTDANLSGANLSAVHFDGAGLQNAILTDADLSGAILEKAYLKQADFTRADLSNASLLESNIEGANLCGTDLTDCNFRSLRVSAAANDDTKFGQNDGLAGNSPHDEDISGWLFLPLSRLHKEERKSINPANARSLSHQVQMLFRDNGLFSRSAYYHEQENYWKTRQCRAEKSWLRYLGRLIFYEFFMGYGERPSRVALTGLFTIVFFGVLFLITGLTMGERVIAYDFTGGIPNSPLFILDFWMSMLFSIQCFTTMGLLVVKPAGALSLTLASFEGLIGFFIIALWIVVFVRKAIRE